MYEYEYYYYDYANYFDEYDYDYLEVRTNLLFICNDDNGWFSRNRHQEADRGEQRLVMRQGRNKKMEREINLQGRVKGARRAIVQ